MNPALHQDLMQARRHDLSQTAAKRRLSAEAKAAHVQEARQAREADAATAPRRGVWRLVWRLFPV